MNLGNQVKQVMICIEQKVYFDKKLNFSRNLLQVSGFCCTFAIAYKTVVVHSSGRTSDAQLVSAGLFLCLQSYSHDILLRLHYLVKLNCPRVSHCFVSNGKCSRFSVSSPVGFAGMLTKQCIMQQLTLQFDGYAPLGTPVNVGSTKQNKSVLSHLSGKVSHVATAAKAALPLKRIGECIFAAVSVVGGFALMFLAALIQG